MPGDLFWEMHQHGRIIDARNEASGARNKSIQVGRELDGLQDRVDRISLACQAMWELLRDRGALDEEELLARIEEIDLRDGRVDGRMGPTPQECPGCGRRSNSRRKTCMYCGAPFTDGPKHVFE
ncbi:MAG: hypothetical protein ABFS86_02285 [Planctomycetota bacterium]